MSHCPHRTAELLTVLHGNGEVPSHGPVPWLFVETVLSHVFHHALFLSMTQTGKVKQQSNARHHDDSDIQSLGMSWISVGSGMSRLICYRYSITHCCAHDMVQEGRTHKVWPIAQVSELHHARYLLQPCALELFMHNHASALLSFQSPKASGFTP